jgi:hypothetical protein
MTTTAVHPTDRSVQQHAEMAVNAFQFHVATQRLSSGLFRDWRFSRPCDSAYAFNITTTPGRIIVTGDIGVLIVERTDDMVSWCRTSIGDFRYFAEKVPHEIPTREYDADVVRAWAKQELADEYLSDAKKKTLRDVMRHWNPEDQSATMQEIHESGICDGCDFPDFTNWKSSFLWCREAIKFALPSLA